MTKRTAAGARELIFHHYDYSPFSEKIRLVFGLKRLAWRSVIVPAVMPKPLLMPLTGGYRHTPVLQVGADVYCDTRLIAAELERRHPAPGLWPPGHAGFAAAIEAWAERDLFWPIARYITGLNAETVEPGLHRDRAALRGKPPPSLERVRAVATQSLPLVRLELGRLEAMLADGRRFLLGEEPGLVDCAVYHAPWFLGAFPISALDLLDGAPQTREWMARVAAIGHGTPEALSADDALAIAAGAAPEPPRPSRLQPGDPAVGARLAIRPEAYDTAAVEGELVFVDANEIALRRHDATVGEVVVHFPRAGYGIRRS